MFMCTSAHAVTLNDTPSRMPSTRGSFATDRTAAPHRLIFEAISSTWRNRLLLQSIILLLTANQYETVALESA
uniref:Secreted protein n=1 Tax=Panagrellus redivivus TaxID=6233 RepID=A0A7E4V2A7_PANRE